MNFKFQTKGPNLLDMSREAGKKVIAVFNDERDAREVLHLLESCTPRAADGGSAFPSTTHTSEGHLVNGPDFGMTLRDYFAAHAMMGEISSMQDNAASEAHAAAAVEAGETAIEHTARISYEMADAMLKARAR